MRGGSQFLESYFARKTYRVAKYLGARALSKKKLWFKLPRRKEPQADLRRSRLDERARGRLSGEGLNVVLAGGTHEGKAASRVARKEGSTSPRENTTNVLLLLKWTGGRAGGGTCVGRIKP